MQVKVKVLILNKFSFSLFILFHSAYTAFLFFKAQNEFANKYQKEQTEYIQNKINKIRDSVEVKQFRIAWYYLPTPPLGQDMTQGQFLSGV